MRRKTVKCLKKIYSGKPSSIQNLENIHICGQKCLISIWKWFYPFLCLSSGATSSSFALQIQIVLIIHTFLFCLGWFWREFLTVVLRMWFPQQFWQLPLHHSNTRHIINAHTACVQVRHSIIKIFITTWTSTAGRIHTQPCIYPQVSGMNPYGFRTILMPPIPNTNTPKLKTVHTSSPLPGDLSYMMPTEQICDPGFSITYRKIFNRAFRRQSGRYGDWRWISTRKKTNAIFDHELKGFAWKIHTGESMPGLQHFLFVFRVSNPSTCSNSGS